MDEVEFDPSYYYGPSGDDGGAIANAIDMSGFRMDIPTFGSVPISEKFNFGDTGGVQSSDRLIYDATGGENIPLTLGYNAVYDPRTGREVPAEVVDSEGNMSPLDLRDLIPPSFSGSLSDIRFSPDTLQAMAAFAKNASSSGSGGKPGGGNAGGGGGGQGGGVTNIVNADKSSLLEALMAMASKQGGSQLGEGGLAAAERARMEAQQTGRV